jgi:hypothetical protein
MSTRPSRQGLWRLATDWTFINTVSENAPSPVTHTGIVSPTRACTITGLTNYEWYTVTLHAMLDSTPILTDTVRVMPADTFVYLPITMQED